MWLLCGVYVFNALVKKTCFRHRVLMRIFNFQIYFNELLYGKLYFVYAKLTAINFFFLKKHSPILFHISALSSVDVFTNLYLFNAPSISFFDCNSNFISYKSHSKQQPKDFTSGIRTCNIAPKAIMALAHLSSSFVASNSLSKALLVSFTFKYNIPISVRTSTFSGIILFDDFRKKWDIEESRNEKTNLSL